MTTARTGDLRLPLRHRVTLIGVVRSEALKIVSVPAQFVTLLSAVPLTLFFTMLDAQSKLDFLNADPAQSSDLVHAATTSMIPLVYLLAIIVSVLSIGSEYANGQIHSTLSAVPRRIVLLFGKIVALGAVLWLTGFVAVLCSAAVALPIFAQGGMALSDGLLPEILLTAVGAGTATMMIGLLALCIAGVLRSVAFGIAASFALILVLPSLVELAPLSWVRELSPYMPHMLAGTLFDHGGTMSPWLGLLLLAATVMIGAFVWVVSLTRRDV